MTSRAHCCMLHTQTHILWMIIKVKRDKNITTAKNKQACLCCGAWNPLLTAITNNTENIRQYVRRTSVCIKRRFILNIKHAFRIAFEFSLSKYNNNRIIWNFIIFIVFNLCVCVRAYAARAIRSNVECSTGYTKMHGLLSLWLLSYWMQVLCCVCVCQR